MAKKNEESKAACYIGEYIVVKKETSHFEISNSCVLFGSRSELEYPGISEREREREGHHGFEYPGISESSLRSVPPESRLTHPYLLNYHTHTHTHPTHATHTSSAVRSLQQFLSSNTEKNRKKGRANKDKRCNGE